MLIDGVVVHPLTLPKANHFLGEFYFGTVTESIFCIGAGNGDLQGAAIVGRPTIPAMDDGYSCEILRLGSARIGCDMPGILHKACLKSMRSMGYRRIVSVMNDPEIGGLLDFWGWQCLGKTESGPLFAAYQTMPAPD